MNGKAIRRMAVVAALALVGVWGPRTAVAQAPEGAELRDRPVRVESEGAVKLGEHLDGRVYGLAAAQDGDPATFAIEASGDGGKDFGQHFKLQTWDCAAATWKNGPAADVLALSKGENGWRFRLTAKKVEGAPEVNPVIVTITAGGTTVRFGVVTFEKETWPEVREHGEPSMAISTTLLETELMPIELVLYGRVAGLPRLGMLVVAQSGGSKPIAGIFWKSCGPGWTPFNPQPGPILPDGLERVQLGMTNANSEGGLHGCVVYFRTTVNGMPAFSRPFGFVVNGAAVRENKSARQPWELLQIGEPSMAVSKGDVDPGVPLEIEIPIHGKTKQEERLKIEFVSAQKTEAKDIGKVGRWKYLDVDAEWKDYDAKTGVPVPAGVEQVYIGFVPEADPVIDPSLHTKEAFTFKVYFDKSAARPSPTPPKKFGFVVHDKQPGPAASDPERR